VDFVLCGLGSGNEPGQQIPAVAVHGDVDASNADQLRADLADLAGPPAPGLVVDLSAVDYFASAAFAMLDDLLSRVRLAIVVTPGSAARAAATLMAIPLHDSVDEARAALRRS
jgi:anti-anti-sigma regulatory factor